MRLDLQIIREVSKILGELTTSSKWKRINDTVIFEMDKSNSTKPFITLIEDIMKPFEFRNKVGDKPHLLIKRV